MRRLHIPSDMEEAIYRWAAQQDGVLAAVAEQYRAAGLIVSDENARIAYVEEA